MLPNCHNSEELTLMKRARQLLSTYSDMEELIRLGAYAKGSDTRIDESIDYHDALETYLTQGHREHTNVEAGFTMLSGILGKGKEGV